MTDVSKCPQCNGDLPANFAAGICPACLLKQGMASGSIDSRGPLSGGGSRRSWTAPTAAELSPRFPHLEIVELLGQGGMGAVYKVRQKELDRWAALKILPDEVASDPTFAERFQREARALAQLGHPHIVTVYEFGQRDGVYFLLMEYVDGVTLRQASRAGQVSTKDALSIVTQICDALQFAHEEGVVHRDIKPENILIDRRGRVKIADFGLAKLLDRTASVPTLTGTQQVMGTPMYMAPEQVEGTKGVDHRADIFSLGVVFYELLTGELPLGRFAPPSKKVSLDVRLDEVVLRTLEKEPDLRYQQAGHVKTAVETIRAQPAAASAARKSSSVSPTMKWVMICLALGLLVPVSFLACLVIVEWFAVQVPAQQATIARPVPTTEASLAAAQFMRSVDQQRAENEERQRLEEATRDPNEESAVVQFTEGRVKLHPRAFTPVELNESQRATLEKILTDVHEKYLRQEVAHTERTVDQGYQFSAIDSSVANSGLEGELWTAIDTQLPVTVQKLLRQRLPLYADVSRPMPQVQADAGSASLSGASASMGGMPGPPIGGMSAPPMGGFAPYRNPQNLRYEQVLGFDREAGDIHITIGRRGKWFTWTIVARARNGNYTADTDQGEAPELPSGLRRFWRENPESTVTNTLTTAVESPSPQVSSEARGTVLINPGEDLNPLLLAMDQLRAGPQTNWAAIEKQANDLLARFPSAADKGRIHWQAAHVYGQSDIGGHARDVIRHAQEALKYERDPVQRGWLFMYLGNASEVIDSSPQNFVERRAVFARLPRIAALQSAREGSGATGDRERGRCGGP